MTNFATALTEIVTTKKTRAEFKMPAFRSVLAFELIELERPKIRLGSSRQSGCRIPYYRSDIGSLRQAS
jgi:hypothetical protein